MSHSDENLYNDAFFEKYLSRKQYIYDHRKIANAIYKSLQPKSVIDVGCGSGQILYWLRRKNRFVPIQDRVVVRGFEKSVSATRFWPKSVKDYIQIADCTEILPRSNVADVVICVEVAEHITEDSSPQLINNLCALSQNFIVFSAAPPGQGGIGHINEQIWDFWEEKFLSNGWIEDISKTNEFRAAIDLDLVNLVLGRKRRVSPWYRSNIRILININNGRV